jgi:hypothetical protein
VVSQKVKTSYLSRKSRSIDDIIAFRSAKRLLFAERTTTIRHLLTGKDFTAVDCRDRLPHERINYVLFEIDVPVSEHDVHAPRMMAMTTSNSTSVKPFGDCRLTF